MTLTDVKDDLRITTSAEDATLARWITEATEQCEARTHRRLISQTLDVFFDGFGPAIATACPPATRRHDTTGRQVLVLSDLTPVQSITSITYVDEGGATQTLAGADYTLAKTEPAKVWPAYGVTWPATRAVPDAVTVRVVCGYTNAAAVPESLKSWIRAAVGVRDRYREAWVDRPPAAVGYIDGLLDRYIVADL